MVILAAGNSSRLGQAKQLLQYKGQTLLHQAIQTALATGITPIITVLGAHEEQLAPLVSEDTGQVHFVSNPGWAEGMASSIRCGISKLLRLVPGVDAVIMMVCDQPFVTAGLLNKLVADYETTGKPIIASTYENVAGTPALFDKAIFAALQQLTGDTGAKKILQANPDWVYPVDFPQGGIDIDTEADYAQLVIDPGEQ